MQLVFRRFADNLDHVDDVGLVSQQTLWNTLHRVGTGYSTSGYSTYPDDILCAIYGWIAEALALGP